MNSTYQKQKFWLNVRDALLILAMTVAGILFFGMAVGAI